MARGEPNDELFEDDCAECNYLQLEGHDERSFVVTPADGGGWTPWGAALLRLFRRIGHEATQAIVITQEPTSGCYAQLLIGHGIAHLEASSNVYLMGDSRLTAEQEDLLGRLGWHAPLSEEDDPDQMPANWRVPLVHGDWPYLVEMIVVTIAGVFVFAAELPIEVRCFQAAHPCRRCSWDDIEEAYR